MKKIALLLIVFAVIGFGLYFYMYKNHRDIATESPNYSITVNDLQSEFNKDIALSNKKYLDKTIEVSGKITSIDLPNHYIVIDTKMTAFFNDSIFNKVSLQKQVKIKGRFLGYDDLLEEFKMDQISLSK
jgi:tRNA_anti-like